jgi:hypothetical protein
VTKTFEVEIRPHEIDALRQIIINVRALATTVISEDDHRRRLLNWAQMIEDVVERIETATGQP